LKLLRQKYNVINFGDKLFTFRLILTPSDTRIHFKL